MIATLLRSLKCLIGIHGKDSWLGVEAFLIMADGKRVRLVGQGCLCADCGKVRDTVLGAPDDGEILTREAL